MNYLNDMFSLENKIVLITGGAGVIASSMAEALLKAGAKVMLWDYLEEPLKTLAARLDNPGLFTLKVDITREQEITQALETTEKTAGLPNVLINAVGGNRGKCAFTDLVVEDFESVVRLNIMAGLVIPTKHIVARWMKDGIKGSIINIASMASYIPLTGVWAYGAAKAAVVNLTMGTANEFAPYGIRVNAIAPGFFIGKQNKDLLIKNEATGELTDRGKSVINHTPFKRFGDISELNGVTIFLAADKASGFITGTTIPVDGGYLIHNI